MKERKFKIGERVKLRSLREGIVSDFYGAFYTVKFAEDEIPGSDNIHCWRVTEEEIEKIEDGLQVLLKIYDESD